jgi:hypothetical protein
VEAVKPELEKEETMRAKWSLILAVASLLVVSVSIVLTKSSQDESAAAVPNRVLMGSAARTDSTTAKSFVDLVPTPGQTFTTNSVSTILVQFDGYARVGEVGRAMDIRAVVDGVPVSPGLMRFSSTGYTTISYAGFLDDVQPGTHTVTMQWQITGGTAYMSNRTFVVWIIPQ